MELKYYLDVLFRRRKVFLVVWATIIVLPLLAGLLRDSMYQATSRAILLKRDMKLLLSSSLPEEFSAYGYFDMDLVQDNFMEMIKSPATLRRVVDKCELDGDPKDAFSSLPYLRFLFMGTKPLVRAENISDTDIFEFQGYASTQDQAQRLSAAYYAAFHELWNQMHQDVIERMETGLVDRQVDLARELAEGMDKERRLKKGFGVGDFTQAITKEYDKLSELKSTLNLVITAMNTLDAEQREIKKTLKKIPQFRAVSEQIEANPVVQDAKSKLANLVWNLSNLKVSLTDEHADIRAILSQMEAMKETIRTESLRTFKTESKEVFPYYEELLKRYNDNEIARFVNQQKEQSLRKQITKQQDDLVILSSQALSLSPVSKENETLLGSLSNCIKGLDAVKLLKKINVSHMLQINKAGREFESKKAYFPNYILLAAFCFFLGLVLALAGALLVEYLDPHCKSRLELEQITRCPVFHVLPHLPATTQFPAQPMRSLAQELVMDQGKTPLVVGLTSTQDGEGKTTIALELASQLAQGGYRILLVDLDPASPQYASLASSKPAMDTSQVMDGAAPLAGLIQGIAGGEDLLRLSGLPGLQLVRLHHRLRELLDQIRREGSYDFVLMDTPPLGRGALTNRLLEEAGVTLMVVGLGLVDAYQLSKCFHGLPPHASGRSLVLVANQERPLGWQWTQGLAGKLRRLRRAA